VRLPCEYVESVGRPWDVSSIARRAGPDDLSKSRLYRFFPGTRSLAVRRCSACLRSSMSNTGPYQRTMRLFSRRAIPMGTPLDTVVFALRAPAPEVHRPGASPPHERPSIG